MFPPAGNTHTFEWKGGFDELERGEDEVVETAGEKEFSLLA